MIKRISYCPDYGVSSGGDIYSFRFNRVRLLKVQNNGIGYLFIRVITPRGEHKFKLIHRLVAEAFLSNYSEELQVNHINGIKSDNRLENLEMVTQSENMLHSFRLKLTPSGSRHYSAKLSEKDVAYIRQNRGYFTQNQLAGIFGVSQHAIWDIIHYKTWIY